MMSQESTVGAALEQDHRRIDEQLAQFGIGLAGGRVEHDVFRSAAADLRRHIWVEEELHFPPLRAAGLLAPVLVMLREHGRIWDLLDLIEGRLADGSAPSRMQVGYGQLETVLNEHNFKEERILYPAGDAQLDADVAAQIHTALTGGERPPDWVCQMAGRDA